MMDWDTLRVVLAIHRQSGISGAAHVLQVSQPTVSRHLARAEADLSCKIFDRRKGRLCATEAGLAIIAEAERVEQQLRRLKRSVRRVDQDMAGPLKISVPHNLLPHCITPELVAFQRLHPEIALTVLVSDDLADVTSGAADVVFRVDTNPRPSLWGKRIATLGYSYFADASLIDRFGGDGCPNLAQDLPLIVHEGATSSTHAETLELFPNGVIVATSNSLEASVSLVRDGMGVCFLPDLVAPSLPGARILARSRIPHNRSLWVLTHKDMRSIRRIEAFIGFMDKRLSRQADRFAQAGPIPVTAENASAADPKR